MSLQNTHHLLEHTINQCEEILCGVHRQYNNSETTTCAGKVQEAHVLPCRRSTRALSDDSSTQL